MKKRLICGITCAYLLLTVIMISLSKRSQELPWYEKYPVICHALGRTREGDTMTNSKEAFLYNYGLGQRVFEGDMQITSDGVMVLRHDWSSDIGQADNFGWTEEEQGAVTAQEFLAAPLYDRYRPLTLEDWFAIMERYPDIYFVTDTKYSAEVTTDIQLIVDTAMENGYEDVLSRVIVQIYYKEMYDEVMSVYPFENVIWTLYYIGYPGRQEILDFMALKKIPVLTVPSSWWSGQMEEELADSGIRVYVHTVDEETEGRQRIMQGVSGIYSDDILPDTVRQWLEER